MYNNKKVTVLYFILFSFFQQNHLGSNSKMSQFVMQKRFTEEQEWSLLSSRSVTVMLQETDSILSLCARQLKASWHDCIYKVCHFRLKTIQITQEINIYTAPVIFAHLNFRILPQHRVSRAIKCYFYLPHSSCTTEHLNELVLRCFDTLKIEIKQKSST